jgi:ubiquinone/menaquinone biosynthesis C-methylase UbiE
MHDVEAEIFDDPFAHHPLRRYSYAWRALRGVAGPHLDVGCGDGSFLAGFRASTGRHAVGVDAQHAYLQIARRPPRDLPVARVSHQGLLPFGDRVFSSVTMLDVLEHCEDELALLEEVRRVTRPGGAVVLTVPARFSMAWLDPDDVKYRWPRFHRLVYSARFGRAAFHRRFEDLSDGARGDCAVERSCHQHYDEREIDDLLEKTGFSRVATRRSGLLGNAGAVMAKLLGSRTERILRSCILLDADVFAAANLFVTAVREP